MDQSNIIRLDLAKRTFQLHGSRADGSVASPNKLPREKALTLLADQSRSLVPMDACGRANHWARAINDLGHEARRIPPVYAKPIVKRRRDGAAEAEANAGAPRFQRFVANPVVFGRYVALQGFKSLDLSFENGDETNAKAYAYAKTPGNGPRRRRYLMRGPIDGLSDDASVGVRGVAI